MNLFQADLDQLTFGQIEDFCRQGIREGTRLDYKARLSSKDPARQVVKAMSALANTQGGLLIYGVATEEGSNRPIWPSDGMGADPSFEQRVIRWCIEHVDPPLEPQVGYVLHPKDSARAFAVLRVEPSVLTPHTVDSGTTVYVRRADNSDPVVATLAEIKLLLDGRRREIQLRDAHRNALNQRMGPIRPDMRTLQVTVIPAFTRSGAIPLRQLPTVADAVSRLGFSVGEVRSISDGIICKHPRGFRLLVTSRAALVYRHDMRDTPSQPPEPISIQELRSWSKMTAQCASALTEVAAYWGSLEVVFEAHGFAGRRVVNRTPHFGTNEIGKCADNQICIELTWWGPQLRAATSDSAAELFWHVLWSFGQFQNLARLEDFKEDFVWED